MLLCAFLLSLPLWECGLKSSARHASSMCASVTPLVGVWIEIYMVHVESVKVLSLPLWECGLKSWE